MIGLKPWKKTHGCISISCCLPLISSSSIHMLILTSGQLVFPPVYSMAEIEHFVNPKDKRHPKFPAIAKKELVLFCQEDQLGSGKTRVMTIGDAVKQGEGSRSWALLRGCVGESGVSVSIESL